MYEVASLVVTVLLFRILEKCPGLVGGDHVCAWRVHAEMRRG